ncbi:hypothetical protein Tco_0303016 [Tanacetum coccineum]
MIRGAFTGIRFDDSLTLSHLFYADDAVFIGKWDRANILTIVRKFLRQLTLLGVLLFPLRSSDLGVKVGMSPSRRKAWDEIIGKVSNRLSKWKIKTLSVGGRLTLIKSVLTSLPLYHMSLYKAPLGVLRDLESLRRKFFNGADINEKRFSMIVGIKFWLLNKRRPEMCPAFLRLIDPYLLKVGLEISFADAIPLARLIAVLYEIVLLSHNRSFPRLYALELKKGITVADKLIDASFVASFRRNPRGGLEEINFHHPSNLVGSISLSPSNDRWAWLLGSSGEFSVHSARTFIDDILLPFVGDFTRWVKVVPIKLIQLRLMMLGEVDKETLGLACGVLLICCYVVDVCYHIEIVVLEVGCIAGNFSFQLSFGRYMRIPVGVVVHDALSRMIVKSLKDEIMYVKFSNNVEAEHRGSYLDMERIKWILVWHNLQRNKAGWSKVDQAHDIETGVPEFWLTAMKNNEITAEDATHLKQLLEENKSTNTKDLHDSGVNTICITDSLQLDLDKGSSEDKIEGLGKRWGPGDHTTRFDNLEAELQKARAQIAKLQRKQLGNNNKISLARFRIAILEQTIEDVQVRHQADNKSLLIQSMKHNE